VCQAAERPEKNRIDLETSSKGLWLRWALCYASAFSKAGVWHHGALSVVKNSFHEITAIGFCFNQPELLAGRRRRAQVLLPLPQKIVILRDAGGTDESLWLSKAAGTCREGEY
jgi:hypothetical protein